MAFAASHNLGRSQINLGGIRAYGDYPFIDMMKAASAWTTTAAGEPALDPDQIDVNGYATNGIAVRTLLFLPRAVDKPGDWILEWDGTGTFSDWTLSGITSGSLTSTGTGICRGVPYSNQMVLQINSQSSTPNHIRNIRFYHSSEATRFNTDGEIFGLDFKARLIQANFGVIRFMDWQDNNHNNSTTWASRKALTFYSYYAQEFRGSAWGADRWYYGATTNVGNAYSISTSRGRAPINGDSIQLYWNADATQSGTCSLNVDGSGAVNILDSYGQALSVGGNSYPTKDAYGTAGRKNYATLIYSSIANAWIKQGGDVAIPESGLSSYTPPELGMRLAAEVGAHPWFCSPVLSLDPITDYMISLATYCRDNGPSWMVPRFEPPNECFNNAGNFFNNGICRALGTGNSYPSSGVEDYVNEYGKFTSVLGQALNTVYGGDRTRYKFLAGVQTTTGSTGGAASNGVNVLTSAAYVAQAAAPQSGYTKTAGSGYLHGIACANYYGPSNYTDPQSASEAAMAAAYAGGDTSQVPAYLALCYGASAGFNIARNTADFSGWKTVASGQGVMEMEFYEGGFSPDYVSGDTNGNLLKAAARDHANLKAIALDDYAVCTAISGGGFTARNPSHYYMSGNKWLHAGVSQSVWAVLDDIYQVVNGPQWDAFIQYNQARRAINLRLRIHG